MRLNIARRSVRMALGAVAFCLLASPAQPARAAMAYALSVMRIENFKITGATPLEHNPLHGVNTWARYTDNEDVEFGGSDPNHAKNGPGPFPAENDFWLGGGLGGDGARADNRVTINNPPPAGFHPAELVAEAQRSVQGTSAGTSLLELGIHVKQTTADPIKIEFHALVELLAQAEATASEHALAQAGYSIDISILSTDAINPTTYLEWSFTEFFTPSWSTTQGGTVSGVAEPFHMKKSVQTSLAGPGSDSKSFSNNGDFSLSFAWAQGVDFQVVARLETVANALVVPVQVPEPGTFALLAGGLATLGIWRARRRR